MFDVATRALTLGFRVLILARVFNSGFKFFSEAEMVFRSLLIVAASSTVLSLAVPSSSAKADVVYTLSNIELSDHTFLNGTFSLDTTGYVAGPPFGAAYGLTTTAGTLPGNNYASGQIPSASINNPTNTVVTFQEYLPVSGPSTVDTLQLTFASTLGLGNNTLLGGLNGLSWECVGFSCPTDGPIRYVLDADVNVVGSVAAVPEPGTWAMLIVGFAGISFMMYRRRASVLMAAA
jgi:hypothetical protein